MTPPGSFADLTPDRILAAADATGVRATGRTWSLGALENRVYEVEREDGSRVVVKFYRPGRHPTAAILRSAKHCAQETMTLSKPPRLH